VMRPSSRWQHSKRTWRPARRPRNRCGTRSALAAQSRGVGETTASLHVTAVGVKPWENAAGVGSRQLWLLDIPQGDEAAAAQQRAPASPLNRAWHMTATQGCFVVLGLRSRAHIVCTAACQPALTRMSPPPLVPPVPPTPPPQKHTHVPAGQQQPD
jgi:hypothetical protein